MKIIAALTVLGATITGPHPITFDDLAAIGAVSDPQISPDGKWVLFTVTRERSSTWRVAVSGGPARGFPDDTTSATEAHWSPDGRRVTYIAHEQLWVVNADGSGRHRLTTLSGGAADPKWSPDASRIAFTSRVYPCCLDEVCNKQMREVRPASVRVATQLLYRHWRTWDDSTRVHLFVIASDGGDATDVTLGAPYDIEPGYAVSPDNKEIAFTAKDDQPWSTNVDVWTVPVEVDEPTNITLENHGADQNPVYSPDGRFIAYQSQARAGFESDRWRLMLYDRQTNHAAELLSSWDRNADHYAFAPDRTLIVGSVDRGRGTIYRVPMAGGTPAVLVGEHNNASFSLSADGRTMAWLRDAADHPAEVYVGTVGPRGMEHVRQLSHVNDALMSQLKVNALEEFWFRGDSVQGFVLAPSEWQPGRTYPAVVLIHGGPQGVWLDTWQSRWNYQMFAAAGLGVILINPHGSTGYGQRFVDAVSKDWGGKAYTDIMDGIDAALARSPWIDRSRLAAAGPSYGGYMVNWIAGHTDRFKALVSHAGPYNLENMYGETDELWFPEWEFGGPYWDSTAMATQYRVYSPHLYAKHFKTPMLVLHGEQDSRVPYTESLALFTALQRQGVPSRLVMFRDEGHWIIQPNNQRVWWSEVLGWLAKYLAAPAP